MQQCYFEQNPEEAHIMLTYIKEEIPLFIRCCLNRSHFLSKSSFLLNTGGQKLQGIHTSQKLMAVIRNRKVSKQRGHSFKVMLHHACDKPLSIPACRIIASIYYMFYLHVGSFMRCSFFFCSFTSLKGSFHCSPVSTPSPMRAYILRGSPILKTTLVKYNLMETIHCGLFMVIHGNHIRSSKAVM